MEQSNWLLVVMHDNKLMTVLRCMQTWGSEHKQDRHGWKTARRGASESQSLESKGGCIHIASNCYPSPRCE